MTQNKLIKSKAGKVLSFEQDGEFFFRRGLDRLDKNNLLDAMVYYRKALLKDPENDEIRMAIAETLTEMYRFEESNRLLFTTFQDAQNRPSECYFGMGMNFLGLKEYDHARDSLEQYTYVDPEGEFIYDAYDILDALDESFEEYGEDDRSLQDAQLARELLEHDDYAGARRMLEQLVEDDPADADARNDLALACYCLRDYRAATEQVRCILEMEPDNVQAHCNMAVFLHGANDEAAAQKEGEYIASVQAQMEDVEDLSRMSLALMELGRFADAKGIQERLYHMLPYDQGTVHRLAQCHCQLGAYKKAAECYERLLKIDPQDSVARYYRAACRAAMAGVPRRAAVIFNYQVPVEEMILRIHKLNRYIGMEAAERLTLWQSEGSEMEQLIRWGVQTGEGAIRRAMLNLVASFADKKAELLLRDFLLQRVQPGDLKREALGLLKHIGAAEPYLGYMDGKLVESRVSLIQTRNGDMPEAYGEVLDICMENMRDRAQLCTMEAANLWSEYVAALEGFPRLNRSQTYALAAVLEYAACRKCGVQTTKSELCRKYAVTLPRFNNAMTKLMNRPQAGREAPETDEAPDKGE